MVKKIETIAVSYMPWKIIKNCLERDCILRIIKGRLCAEEKCTTTMYGAKIIEMRNMDFLPQQHYQEYLLQQHFLRQLLNFFQL